MRIVVLDGAALNPGDLSWEALARLGDLVVHPRSAPAEIVARARGATIVLTNKARLDRALFAALPELEFVAVIATGTDVVDLAAAADHGVVVSNVPEYSTASVAQHVFALLLEVVAACGAHDAAVRAGEWSRAADWCFWRQPLAELEGRTLGIVGLGRIGRRVASIGAAFGMRVIAAQRPVSATGSSGRPYTVDAGAAVDPAAQARPSLSAAGGPLETVVRLPLDDLLAAADVVSLHCPLTPATRQLIDARRLALMRPAAILINTARGALIDEAALAAALHAGRLGGAGLDVLALEPPPADHPLLAVPRCVITPHLAWATRAARARLMEVTAGNVQAFLAGAPRYTVGRPG